MTPTPPELDGRTLLAIARASIASALDAPAPAWSDQPWLRALAATFVTLTRRGELRGCIGSLEAKRPLAEDVAENAHAAAFRDPRFEPVGAGDLDGIGIEVSVLTRPIPLPATNEPEALRLLRPGVDGVVLSAAGRRSTFLPQVWEELPDPAAFLAQLRVKAGLPPWAWPADTRLDTYQVTKFSEPGAGRDRA